MTVYDRPPRLQDAQPLTDPYAEHGDEYNSPQDAYQFQIPAYDVHFVPDLILFPSEMSFGIIKDNVVLFLHVEHAAVKEHHNSRARKHRFNNDQTRKGSVHPNPPKNVSFNC